LLGKHKLKIYLFYYFDRWYINGEEADPSLLSPHHIHKSPETGLETSRLDLRFRLTEKHFRRAADLKLKCTATIATIYWRSNEEAVQIVRKQTEYSQYRSQVQPHSVQCTAQFILYRSQVQAQCTMHSTVYTVQISGTGAVQYTVQFILYISQVQAQCTMCSTVYTGQIAGTGTVYNVQYSLYCTDLRYRYTVQ
jgi:hypothetical protein